MVRIASSHLKMLIADVSILGFLWLWSRDNSAGLGSFLMRLAVCPTIRSFHILGKD